MRSSRPVFSWRAESGLPSKSGRLAFFGLADYARRRNAKVSPEELEYARYLMVHPLALHWVNGFYETEHESNRLFRWCNATGEIHIDNDTAARRRASITMTLVAAHPPARLTIDGDLLSTGVDLVAVMPFTREIDVPPGHHVIRFACDGKRADAPTDPRTMVWRIENFVFEELPVSSVQSH
jgi:hypothetical protein